MYASRPPSFDDELADKEMDMISVAAQMPADPGVPILMPSMRKIRHITGIALRNLALSPPEDLRRPSIISESDPDQTYDSLILPNSPELTPVRRRNRRMASLPLNAYVPPKIQLLDSMVAFYSPGQDEPIFISEPVYQSDNPEFKEINFQSLLKRHGDVLTVVAYARSDSQEPSQLFTKRFSLSDLLFIGRTFDSINFAFSINSFILVLSDGCYTLDEYLPKTFKPLELSSDNSGATVPSASYDTIMKIQNLQYCILDSEQAVAEINTEIDQVLALQPAYYASCNETSQLRQKINKMHLKTAEQKSKIAVTQNKLKLLRDRIETRKKAVESARQRFASIENDIKEECADSAGKLQQIHASKSLIAYEHARAVRYLETIFPIDHIADKQLEFTICGLPLPDMIKANELQTEFDEDEIGACYGFVCQLVFILSLYLRVPLRYPVQPYGSTSFILDPISTIQGSRAFPLWTKGSLFYRFEYGVYLIHKNIEQLVNSEGVVVSDLRHTLANLKNLFLVVQSRGESNTMKTLDLKMPNTSNLDVSGK